MVSIKGESGERREKVVRGRENVLETNHRVRESPPYPEI